MSLPVMAAATASCWTVPFATTAIAVTTKTPKTNQKGGTIMYMNRFVRFSSSFFKCASCGRTIRILVKGDRCTCQCGGIMYRV